MAESEGFAYVADADGALVVVDVTTKTAPVVVGTVAIGGTPQSVELSTDKRHVMIAAGADGLIVVDVQNPAAPAVTDELELPGLALQVALDGSKALVANWNDVRLIDISDPANLRSLASERIELDGTPRVLGASLMNGVAYLGEWTGFYAYTVADEVAAPDLWAAETSIDFGVLDSGGRSTRALVLRNDGTLPLVAWELSVTDPQFTVTPSTLYLKPGEAQAVEVTATASNSDPHSACLAIRSDDPDDRPKTIELFANLDQLSVGDEAPDVEAQLLDGGSWSLEDQKGKVVVMAYFATF